MTANDFIAVFLPFLLSYLIQALAKGVPTIAQNTLTIILPRDTKLQGVPHDLAITLAIQVYRQVSFLVSVLLSTVSAMALTLTSTVPAIGVLAAFLLVGLVAVWFFRWQTLGANPNERESRDRQMKFGSLTTTTIMMIATLWARWH
ncbi:hypothetical protein [Caballeronia sp. KNU42]